MIQRLGTCWQSWLQGQTDTVNSTVSACHSWKNVPERGPEATIWKSWDETMISSLSVAPTQSTLLKIKGDPRASGGCSESDAWSGLSSTSKSVPSQKAARKVGKRPRPKTTEKRSLLGWAPSAPGAAPPLPSHSMTEKHFVKQELWKSGQMQSEMNSLPVTATVRQRGSNSSGCCSYKLPNVKCLLGSNTKYEHPNQRTQPAPRAGWAHPASARAHLSLLGYWAAAFFHLLYLPLMDLCNCNIGNPKHLTQKGFKPKAWVPVPSPRMPAAQFSTS